TRTACGDAVAFQRNGLNFFLAHLVVEHIDWGEDWKGLFDRHLHHRVDRILPALTGYCRPSRLHSASARAASMRRAGLRFVWRPCPMASDSISAWSTTSLTAVWPPASPTCPACQRCASVLLGAGSSMTGRRPSRARSADRLWQGECGYAGRAPTTSLSMIWIWSSVPHGSRAALPSTAPASPRAQSGSRPLTCASCLRLD